MSKRPWLIKKLTEKPTEKNLSKGTVAKKLVGCALMGGVMTIVGCSTEVLTYSQDYKRQGMKEYDQGQYARAVGSFTAAAKQDPTDPVTQFYLGESDEATDNYNQAIIAYKLCLNLLPQTPAGRANVQMHDDAVNHLVSVISKSDQAEQEIDALEADANKNQDPQTYAIVARIFALRGDPDSAINAYRHALVMAPDDFEINKAFGLYLTQMGQAQLAEPVLMHAHQLNGGDKEVINALAQAGGSAPAAPTQ